MTAPAQPRSPQPPDGAEDRPDRPATGDNRPEFTVSELATKLKQVVEQSFSFVRVRAEVGRVTFHGNGHVYLDLKDEKAVLNGVVWRPTVPRLKIRPEQGREVVATGRLTTFPGRSQYQMVIEQIEPAGVGALMALLEKRKAAMAAEGLFDDARKKALPYLPEVIGVVTSPTGAVIRDILHRLNDRFPRRVLLWPVMVQGDQAAEQVAKAVAGFNTFEAGGAIPRPDLLIVARGGGSIEDLWPFNEEAVVRAVAASAIPVISAVGHETDTTLIDFVADRRAPTPTAAAEMAVPVRAELLADLLDKERRLVRGLTRGVDDRRQRLVAATRGLPRADDLVPAARQRLDYASSRLATALRSGAALWQARFDRVKGGLRSETMAARIGQGEDRLRRLERALAKAPGRTLDRL
ncbi:MAG: exodeoxyribonuclease VII large subunit, partial [Alphaproteobacteria bacterium]